MGRLLPLARLVAWSRARPSLNGPSYRRLRRTQLAMRMLDEEGTVGTEYRVEWPPWWEWELELTPHVERRMEDRDFTEIDLRLMLETAHGYREDPIVAGRFIVETRHRGADWEVVVEPDQDDHWLVVVTAYPLGAGR